MAQSKLNDLAGKFGKGGPPGLGLGLKLLAVGGAAIYGITQSLYTGESAAPSYFPLDFVSDDITSMCIASELH